MKFTQQQAFEKIKGQLGAARQISERSITETLETLMPFADEEIELDAFVSKISKTFITMDGNVRAEVAAKAKALEDAKPNAKTPEEIAAEAAKAKDADDEPAWAKRQREASEARFAELEKKLTGQEAAKTESQRKVDAMAAMKAKNFSENIIEVADMNFNWGSETAIADFEKSCIAIGAKFGVTPVEGNPSTKTDKELFAEQKKSLQEQGIIPKDN